MHQVTRIPIVVLAVDLLALAARWSLANNGGPLAIATQLHGSKGPPVGGLVLLDLCVTVRVVPRGRR
jgi:hypothetical protein